MAENYIPHLRGTCAKHIDTKGGAMLLAHMLLFYEGWTVSPHQPHPSKKCLHLPHTHIHIHTYIQLDIGYWFCHFLTFYIQFSWVFLLLAP